MILPAHTEMNVPDPAPESPCVRECRIDEASGFCQGCLRTLDEICRWPRLTDDGKREVLRQLPARQPHGSGPEIKT